jgi:ADP-dependent phosphofructokinase/glucokinase
MATVEAKFGDVARVKREEKKALQAKIHEQGEELKRRMKKSF